MATETLFDGLEIEAMGSTNMSIISVFGSRGAAAAAAGHIIKER